MSKQNTSGVPVFEKLQDLFEGVASGVAKGMNELKQDTKEVKKQSNKPTAVQRLAKLEKDMKEVKELIALLQKQVMMGDFDIDGDDNAS